MNCFARFLAARVRSIGFAIEGLVYVVRTEGNARVHLVVSALVLALGFGFGVSRLEWMVLAGAIGLVWVGELLNTALENLCDLVEPERSEGIKRVKDVAAGAVLLAAIVAVIIGGLVFWPYIRG